MSIMKLGSPDGVLLRSDDSIATTAATTEQVLMQYPIVAGSLTMTNRLRLTFYCSLTTPTLLPGTVTIRIKYGSSVLTLGGGALTLLGNANNSPFTISANLSNKANTSSQFLYGEIRQQGGGLSLVSPVTQNHIFPAVNSATDQLFQLTVQFSNALSSLTIQQAEASLN